MKKIENKTLQEWIEQETAAEDLEFCGVEIENFRPVICEKKQGDGLQLVWVKTLMQRPRYWLVLIDSKMNVNSEDFDVEFLISIIEDEFGSGCDYPEIDDDGIYCGSIVNFG